MASLHLIPTTNFFAVSRLGAVGIVAIATVVAACLKPVNSVADTV